MASKIEIKVFGRDRHPESKIANKTARDIKKKNKSNSVRHTYYDMDNVNGLVEGALYDVRFIPTTLVLLHGRVVKKWERDAPSKSELSIEIDRYDKVPNDIEIDTHKRYLRL